MASNVGLPAIFGTTLGTIIGYAVGGATGAAVGGEIGTGIGLKVSIWEHGTFGKTSSKGGGNTNSPIIDSVAKFVLTAGFMTFIYLCLSKTAREDCVLNPSHQICQIFPYIDLGLQAFSAVAMAATIAFSIYKTLPLQLGQPGRRNPGICGS